MRHVLTLVRPTPPALSTAPRHAASRFRSAHAGLAVVHLVQAVLVLVIAGDTRIAIHDQTGASAGSSLLDVSVGVLMAAYFVAAALNHGLSATLLRRFYEAELAHGRNRIRWAEFAVSAPILMLLIALYTGVTDLAPLVVIGAATIVMIVCGWMQESLNPPDRRTTTMVPFWSGVLAALVPWSIVAAHLMDAPNDQDFVVSIFLSLFILWACFGVNQWLQYYRFGPWSDYYYGEQTYLVLSLVAKSALAWQIVAGSSLR
ncbi:heliorhodopsin HeR [Nocardioides dilutus]